MAIYKEIELEEYEALSQIWWIIFNHADKISNIEHHSLVDGRLNPRGETTSPSPWCLKLTNQPDWDEEWNELENVFQVISNMSLFEIIIPALQQVNGYYEYTYRNPRREEDTEYYFSTLLLHPIALEFWITVIAQNGIFETREALQQKNFYFVCWRKTNSSAILDNF